MLLALLFMSDPLLLSLPLPPPLPLMLVARAGCLKSADDFFSDLVLSSAAISISSR